MLEVKILVSFREENGVTAGNVSKASEFLVIFCFLPA